MRYRFAREGILTPIGKHFFEPESIKWDSDRRIPVTWSNNFSDPEALMGYATDIQREDDGWLTAEIEWTEKGRQVEDFVNKDFFLTVYLNHLEETDTSSQDDGQRTIHSGNLKGIFAAVGGAHVTGPWEPEKDPWCLVEPDVLCPECSAGKEINCTGEMVHPVTDQIVTCATAK